MEKKYSIPIIAISVFLVTILINFDTDFIIPVYAIDISSFSITASPDNFDKIGNVLYTLNSSTGDFRAINLLTGEEIISTSVSTNGTNFGGFRCDEDDCWQLRYTIGGTSYGILSRISGTTGAVEENRTFVNTFSGSSDIGLFGSTIYFARVCTATDIGGVGGDTDLAMFAIDGNSFSEGDPVQHTPCSDLGIGATVLSSGSQGVLSFKGQTINSNNRMAVVINGAAGAADIFRYINLEQALTTTEDTTLCSQNLGANAFSSANGRNIQFSSNKAFVNVGSGAGDTYIISTVTNVCAVNSTAAITAFNTGQANMALAPALDILYIGGVEADGTGSIVNGYDFTGDVVSTTLLFSVIAGSTNTLGYLDYTTTIDTVYLFGNQNTVIVVSFGAIAEGSSCIEIVEGGSQICYEDTDGNGIPNFPNGSFDNLRQPNQNITTIGASLTCAIGFNDTACENDNPKENGVGLLLLIILVIVSYSFLVSIHIGAVKVLNRQNVAVMDYLNINPVLLLVMLIIDVGAAFFMNWIPDVIFFTVVVVMGGLAAWGYFSAVKGRGSSA